MDRTSKVRKPRASLGAIAAALVLSIALALALALGASSYEACAVYDSSLLLPGDAQENGTDAGSDPCHHATVPARPDGGDSEGGDLEVVAAFKMIDIGLTSDASAPRPPYGYDLDGVCTCPGPPSCAPQHADAAPACDTNAAGITGIDNTDIDLFRALGVAASTGTAQIDDGLQAGQYGLLLVIDGYNGAADDPSVTVSYYVSNGVNRASDGGLPTPDFKGADLWTIDPDSLANRPADPSSLARCAHNPQCASAYKDDQAYVSNGVVVAHFNGTPLPVAFGDRSFLGGATMRLSSAYIVGQLRPVSLPTGFAYELTGGTIAGRWSTGTLLSTLATIPDPAIDGGFLCGNTLYYGLIKNAVCGAADISLDRTNDNASPLLTCDAVSVGMRFTAGPAQLGAVFSVPPAPAGCKNGGFPFTDSCN